MSEPQQPEGRTLRPRPNRRAFDLPPPSAESSAPPSPYPEQQPTLDLPESNNKDKDDGLSSRSRSVQNLTSSTLFGIYSPTAFDGGSSIGGGGSRDELNTPWGTGAQTPSRRQAGIESIPEMTSTTTTHFPSHQSPHRQPRTGVLSMVMRSSMLFGFGVAYGVIVTHFHDSPTLAPVRVEGIQRLHGSWEYMVFWGVAGILLGSLLPWWDTVWEGGRGRKGEERRRGGVADWYAVVRSVGAFVGIAFAIRKLPWQSTLQVSLTLALVNPVLWYLIDRSKPGFVLSAIVGVSGMLVLLGINPEMVPPPATSHQGSMVGNGTGEAGVGGGEEGGVMMGGISHETIAVGTWIASVLFCSCVCFGNIGRRLALGRGK
ncbi:hypothetical protein FQN54_007344 [Arachnomyces sp. PD_36]|nr:hypothetical protein FQN54_007344 [Arachnomyces sp. PD_36]